jgi:hypothetical protein
MKTFKPHFDQFALDKLKFALLEKIGYKISTKPDCAKLADIISESGYGRISESTLYRLFFQFEKHKPYKSTLDILCQFMGYKDSIEFIEKLAESRQQLHFSGINTLPNKSNGLLFYCIENTAKSPLIDFFDETNELDHSFKTDVSVAVFDGLLKTSQHDWFFKEFAQEKYIREYFLERGHDTQFRIKNYDQAYLTYLESVHKDKDITHFQDYLFGNCVLFRYYFISQKTTKAQEQAKVLYEEKLNVEAHQNDLFIFPFIRFTAYKLWYLELTNLKPIELEGYALYLIDLCQRFKGQFEMMEQKILFHTVAETFVHSSIPESFHWELKKVFKDAFQCLPEVIYTKHLKYSLPYFNMNGLLHFRP